MGLLGESPVVGDLGTSGYLDTYRGLFPSVVLGTLGDLGNFHSLSATGDLIALGYQKELWNVEVFDGIIHS